VDVLDLLAREGLLAAGSIEELRRQAGPAIGAAADSGLVTDEAIADLVAREANTVVIDLDRGTLESEAVHLLPRELARQLLAVVVAVEPTGRAVRVAFANPLDRSAIDKVARATQRSVRALVATVSAIRRVLDREYGDGSSDLDGDPDMPRESTRKVPPGASMPSEIPPEDAPRTLPVHRPEHEATIEQRHEALLLALIEKGVLTRAEYGDALQRLLARPS
jgi:hypothetical protein